MLTICADIANPTHKHTIVIKFLILNCFVGYVLSFDSFLKLTPARYFTVNNMVILIYNF